MALSLYWIEDPPCYVIADGVDDIFKVMTEAWGHGPEHDNYAVNPVLIPSDTKLVVADDIPSPGTMGPSVAEAAVARIDTAAGWIETAGRGLLIVYDD